MASGRKPRPVPERMEACIERVTESGCWLWLGSTIRGYGVLSIGSRGNGTKRLVYAHRLSWELNRGPIRDGLHVLHRCDVPACCNPDHLFLGTHDDNMADMLRKGRAPHGVSHGRSRLTEDQVREIRAAHGRGVRPIDLARKHGVSDSAIHKIINWTTWSHA